MCHNKVAYAARLGEGERKGIIVHDESERPEADTERKSSGGVKGDHVSAPPTDKYRSLASCVFEVQ